MTMTTDRLAPTATVDGPLLRAVADHLTANPGLHTEVEWATRVDEIGDDHHDGEYREVLGFAARALTVASESDAPDMHRRYQILWNWMPSDVREDYWPAGTTDIAAMAYDRLTGRVDTIAAHAAALLGLSDAQMARLGREGLDAAGVVAVINELLNETGN